MTESIVRDPQVDGHWTVYIDGLPIGELISDEIDGWPVSYHYTIGFYVGTAYPTLAEANENLISTYKAHATAQLP
jgi:hypothetical protein